MLRSRVSVFSLYVLLFLFVDGRSITLLQISDLHTRRGRLSDVESIRLFNSSILPALHPDRVIVTGDVVMGYETRFFSKSVESQWTQYDRLWQSQHSQYSVSRENWLDVPGNHDYAMSSSKDPKDGVKAHFAQGGAENGVFSVIETDESKVCLVGVDTSYLPHMPYWLNLYGFLSIKTRNQVLQAVRKNGCSLSIAFGHIPLASLNTRSILHLFQQADISHYLSGHLHDSYGTFYYNYRSAYDMELPSLAYSGAYRLILISDNWLAFVDRSVRDTAEPFLLFLNPPLLECNPQYSLQQWIQHVRESLTVHVALYALEAEELKEVHTLHKLHKSETSETSQEANNPLQRFEWTAFSLTLDGEPIVAILPQDEMNGVMELEWLWDARDLPACPHTLDVQVTYRRGEKTGVVRAQRVFDLSEKQTGRANTLAQTWTMVKLRWVEPLGAALVTLTLSLATLLLLKQPRRLLALFPSIGKQVRQLRSDSGLFSLFFTAALSLIGCVYFCGIHDHSFVLSFLWGTLTFSREDGWNYFFWSEIAMWSMGTSICVLLPMLVFCLLRLQPLQSRYSMWVERGCLLIALAYTLIQTALLVGNFSSSLWLLSWNTFWLPPFLIVGCLMCCNRRMVGGDYHVV